MAELAGRRVGADMNAVEKSLSVLYPSVAVPQVDAMVTQRLDLGAEECEAGFEGLFDEEIVPGFTVIGNELAAVFGSSIVVDSSHRNGAYRVAGPL